MDFKICGIAAAGAFTLSFLVGLVSGAGFLFLFVRAFASGVFVFGFVAGVQLIVSRFLPELLGGADAVGEEPEGRDEVSSYAGSRVDLSIGDDSAFNPADNSFRPAGGLGEDEPETLYGDADPIGTKDGSAGGPSGLDQRDEGGYTVSRTGGAPSGEAFRDDAGHAVPARPPELIGDVDVLPDLESMSDSFVSSIVDETREGGDAERPPAKRGSVGDGAEKFDPREMASAIQTILKRDQKG
ncbi:MAG: hypothetical protein A2Z99_05900 [Treponema sp. GWB1_62_6]|nr:MAG: hypothetical protein A2001_01090 [Treponema sp. GWC1_61_84]OHE72053.1 MAG: hypothetical protein A2Z99_05900 [Treponema sp. GWB1_62_6]HCM27964.1 hypothetical protein [Treponema sp.]